jgi:DNA gyrase subunit B
MLSSQEVGTLVTALGCGIGREEFNADKLRYHNVVIMTDADVDGSHIRTLLLTFFFRQMPELLERGHIFIAQPPLYKIKKGKQERYVKDDGELNAYFIELALQNASVFVNSQAPALQGEVLQELVVQLQAVYDKLERLHRKYPKAVSSLLIRLPRVTGGMLRDEAQMDDWSALLADMLAEQPGYRATVTTRYDEEHEVFLPEVEIMLKGVTEQVRFTNNFFSGPEYEQIGEMADRLAGLLEADAYVQRGDRSEPVQHFVDAFAWLLTEAKRGLDIQRYKGLGEMNPAQLWETTMDPEVRRMLQVTVDDAVGADQMFTTLMGDQVEPRREFIQNNALAVVNLDV